MTFAVLVCFIWSRCHSPQSGKKVTPAESPTGSSRGFVVPGNKLPGKTFFISNFLLSLSLSLSSSDKRDDDVEIKLILPSRGCFWLFEGEANLKIWTFFYGKSEIPDVLTWRYFGMKYLSVPNVKNQKKFTGSWLETPPLGIMSWQILNDRKCLKFSPQTGEFNWLKRLADTFFQKTFPT